MCWFARNLQMGWSGDGPHSRFHGWLPGPRSCGDAGLWDTHPTAWVQIWLLLIDVHFITLFLFVSICCYCSLLIIVWSLLIIVVLMLPAFEHNQCAERFKISKSNWGILWAMRISDSDSYPFQTHVATCQTIVASLRGILSPQVLVQFWTNFEPSGPSTKVWPIWTYFLGLQTTHILESRAKTKADHASDYCGAVIHHCLSTFRA